MDVYSEDGVGAAAVLVHVVGPDGSVLQPLLYTQKDAHSLHLTSIK